jgi:hypothetical protein
MHKSRLGALIIDCRTDDLSEAAAFWTAALGYDRAPEQTDDRYVSLVGPSGEVAISLQKVEHDSRVHLDIESDDIEAETERLIALGAREVARLRGWVVLEAPSGHRFCVVKPQRPDFAANATPHA